MANTNRNGRVGFGEFEESSRWRSRRYLQLQILEEVEVEAPAVLEGLADDVLPLYRAAVEYRTGTLAELIGLAGNEEFSEIPGFNDVFTLPSYPNWFEIRSRAENGAPEFIELQDALRGWMREWFKDEAFWVTEAATNTLRFWAHPKGSVVPEWRHDDEVDSARAHSPILQEAVSFEFEFEGWPFWREYRQEWLDRVDHAYQKARMAYVRRWSGVAEGLELVATKEQRRKSWWHVPAFVQFQIRGETKKSIIKRLKLDCSNRQVDRALHTLATEVRIKLRRESSGRPPGSSDLHRGGTRRQFRVNGK